MTRDETDGWINRIAQLSTIKMRINGIKELHIVMYVCSNKSIKMAQHTVRPDMVRITTKRAISYLASLRNVKTITFPPEDSGAAT